MYDQMSFLDAELKIERANQHIRDVEHWIATYLDACPYSVGVDPDPQTGQPRLYFIEPTIEAQPLAAIIGDAAHNLRAGRSAPICWLGRGVGSGRALLRHPGQDRNGEHRGGDRSGGQESGHAPVHVILEWIAVPAVFVTAA